MTLALVNLSLTLAGHTLVAPFSATVEPGQVLVLMGDSGSGKSSLLSYMAGLLEAPLSASGQVLLGGRDITTLPTEQRQLGLLFQDDLLFPHMSVLDNLLFALPAGQRQVRVASAAAALATAGLAGFEARRPSSLSGGQRARVSLLRALLSGPRVLLLDEPFGKLDALLREQMRQFVWAQLRQHQVCGVLVTHDVQDVPQGAQVVQLSALMSNVNNA